MKISDYSKHIDLKNTKINDEFWSRELELVRKEVIPYQYEALHDRIDGAEKSYCVENFVKAGKAAEAIRNGDSLPVYPADKWCYDENNSDKNAFHGWVFQDSDAYKWLEAAGYSLINHPDEALKKQALELAELICAAQLDNGYLDTLYIINNRDEVFSNLKDFHELYCFGHLTEGAVSIFNATGSRALLDAACRFADLICSTFGEDKIRGYPGHEIAEMALVRLYDITGEKKYLDTAKFFIDERGKKPYYYDLVLGRKTVNDNYHYNQAHMQPRFQREAVGHAVRGVYLYSAMADVAKRYRDDELYSACKALMDNILNQKMYITGGIGANADGESFSFNYDLPNDLAYSETCASIGLIFFARRMLEISPNADYAQAMETALYNTVLSGMAQDGKSFFYVNPLEVLPIASHTDSRKQHVKPVRQKWFGCACCPPNLARLISSLAEYTITENENTVFIHQYIGGEYLLKSARLNIKSTYSQNGRVTVKADTGSPFILALRVPEWCADSYSVSCAYTYKNRYIYINIAEDAVINLVFDMKIRLIKCSNRVRANVGKAAVTRGPFVYCMEQADNGENLQMLCLGENPEFTFDGSEIIAQGFREQADDKLYCEYSRPKMMPVNIKFIPYYRWGNRGENEMSVYVRV